MDVFTYSDARANLKAVMDKVVDDCTQVVVTRQKGEPVVMVSLSDWNAMAETMHLLSTPANAERLRGSIRQLDAGKGSARRLRSR
jgi:antitoxin YefM